MKLTDQAGFTVVEFLIALSVFSAVLMIMIFGIIHFTLDYYKINLTSSTQSELASLSSVVEQEIKLTTPGSWQLTAPVLNPSHNPSCPTGDMGTPPNCYEPGVFCAGNEEYAFFLGEESPDEAPYSVYEFPVPTGNCYSTPQTNPSSMTFWQDGRSVLGDNFRLLTFNIAQIGSTNEVAVTIKIAHTSGGSNNAGDDLLCDQSISGSNPGSCAAGSPNLVPELLDYTKGGSIVCRLQTGSQFCAVATSNSTISQYTS